MRTLTILLLVAATVGAARAQAQNASPIPAPTQQIAAAVLALPAELRDGASVLGYGTDGALRPLRRGNGDMICLADDPRAPEFHVACYHASLEPFMARGRELRAQGTVGTQVDTVRFAEVKSGKLKMPTQPAALYTLTGPAGSWDPATGKVTGARPLYVVYIPYATTKSTGLSASPQRGSPWIMFPGTPKAHIMFTPGM